MKSSWAYKNGQKMDRETKEALHPKQPKVSFVQRGKRKLYAEYGNVKTYANNKQVDNRVTKLREQGYRVIRSLNYPYVIVLLKEEV